MGSAKRLGAAYPRRPCLVDQRVAVTSDGQRAVSASADDMLNGGLLSGREIATFTLDSPAESAVSRGSTVIAGDGSGRVHLIALQA